jgi:FMN reductase
MIRTSWRASFTGPFDPSIPHAYSHGVRMPVILAVSGSPSATSRTALAVDRVLTELPGFVHTTEHVAVRDLPAADLLAARRDTPALWAATDAVAQADGIVIATPIYKAAYTGLLKAFLDLLPENALAGKAVLPLATGGTVGHLLAVDYALRPVLVALGASHVTPARFLLDADLAPAARPAGTPGPGAAGTGAAGRGTAAGVLLPDAERRIVETARQFSDALAKRVPALAAGV